MLNISKISIIYDSRTGNTEEMAQAIAEGAKSVEDVNVNIHKVGENFSLEEIAEADAVIFGSPTHYNDVTIAMRKFLESLEKLDLKDKIGAAFGSFGFKEEKIDILNEKAIGELKRFMQDNGIELVDREVRVYRTPNKSQIEKCRKLGWQIAEMIK